MEVSDSSLATAYVVTNPDLGKVLTGQTLEFALQSGFTKALDNARAECAVNYVKKLSSFTSHHCKQILSESQKKNLQIAFGRFNIDFTHAWDAGAHRYLRAIRALAFDDALRGFNYNRNGPPAFGYDVKVKLIGENPMLLLDKTLTHVHACHPNIDVHDDYRHRTFYTNVQTFQSNDKVTLSIHEKLKKGNPLVRCVSKSQKCNIKAEFCMCNHSSYDMTTLDLITAMEAARAKKLVGFIMFDPMILFKDTGYIEEIDVTWRKFTVKGKKKISFELHGDTQPHYVHDYSTYMDIFCSPVVKSYRGSLYHIRITSYKLSHIFFEIAPFVSDRVVDTDVHWSLPIPDFTDKTVVHTYKLDTVRDAYARDVKFEELDESLEMVTIIVDTSLHDRALSFALSLEETKFLIQVVKKAVLSFNNTVVVNGATVTNVKNKLAPEDIMPFVVYIYMTAYEINYGSSKVLSALKRDIADTRDNALLSRWKRFFNPRPVCKRGDVINDEVAGVLLREAMAPDSGDSSVTDALRWLSDKISNWVKNRTGNQPLLPFFARKMPHSLSFCSFVAAMQEIRPKMVYNTEAPPVRDDFVEAMKAMLEVDEPDVWPECPPLFEYPTLGDGSCVYRAMGVHTKLSVPEIKDRLLQSQYLKEDDAARLKVVPDAEGKLPVEGWGHTGMLRDLFSAEFNCNVCIHDGEGFTRSEFRSGRVTYHFQIDGSHCSALVTYVPDKMRSVKLEAVDTGVPVTVPGDTYELRNRRQDAVFAPEYSGAVIRNARQRYFKFAGVQSKFVSRGGVKLAEILTGPLSDKDYDTHLDLCFAPGGFIQAFKTIYGGASCGITKTGAVKFSTATLYPDTTILHPDAECDITSGVTRAHVVHTMRKKYPGGVDLVTADGAPDTAENKAIDIVDAGALLRAEIMLAVACLKFGGDFVVKVFDFGSSVTLPYVYLLTRFFESVTVTKPLTSRPASSEVYLVCERFTQTQECVELGFMAMMVENKLPSDFVNSALIVARDFIQTELVGLAHLEVCLRDSDVNYVDDAACRAFENSICPKVCGVVGKKKPLVSVLNTEVPDHGIGFGGLVNEIPYLMGIDGEPCRDDVLRIIAARLLNTSTAEKNNVDVFLSERRVPLTTSYRRVLLSSYALRDGDFDLIVGHLCDRLILAIKPYSNLGVGSYRLSLTRLMSLPIIRDFRDQFIEKMSAADLNPVVRNEILMWAYLDSLADVPEEVARHIICRMKGRGLVDWELPNPSPEEKALSVFRIVTLGEPVSLDDLDGESVVVETDPIEFNCDLDHLRRFAVADDGDFDHTQEYLDDDQVLHPVDLYPEVIIIGSLSDLSEASSYITVSGDDPPSYNNAVTAPVTVTHPVTVPVDKSPEVKKPAQILKKNTPPVTPKKKKRAKKSLTHKLRTLFTTVKTKLTPFEPECEKYTDLNTKVPAPVDLRFPVEKKPLEVNLSKLPSVTEHASAPAVELKDDDKQKPVAPTNAEINAAVSEFLDLNIAEQETELARHGNILREFKNRPNVVEAFASDKADFVFWKEGRQVNHAREHVTYDSAVVLVDGKPKYVPFANVKSHSVAITSAFTSLMTPMKILAYCEDFRGAVEVAEDTGIVQAAPGTGKTTHILDNVVVEAGGNNIKSMIVCSTKQAKEDTRKRLANTLGRKLDAAELQKVRTVNSILINGKRLNSEIDNLWVDEALMSHPGALALVCHFIKPKKIRFVGDVCQIQFVNRIPTFVVKHSFRSLCNNIVDVLEVSWRCPLDVAARLNTLYLIENAKFGRKVGMKSANVAQRFRDTCSKVKINSVNDVPVDENVYYLCFTQAEKQTLAKHLSKLKSKGDLPLNTVHEFQGSQSKVVYVVRLSHTAPDDVYLSLPHAIVALSRHTDKLVYFTRLQNGTDALSKLIDAKPSDKDLKDAEHVKVLGYSDCPLLDIVSDVTPKSVCALPYIKAPISHANVNVLVFSVKKGSDDRTATNVLNHFGKLGSQKRKTVFVRTPRATKWTKASIESFTKCLQGITGDVAIDYDNLLSVGLDLSISSKILRDTFSRKGNSVYLYVAGLFHHVHNNIFDNLTTNGFCDLPNPEVTEFVHDIKGNLAYVNSEIPIALCVDATLAMGAGCALDVAVRHGRPKIKSMEMGACTWYYGKNNRKIYLLCTSPSKGGAGVPKHLLQSVRALAGFMSAAGEKKVAINPLGMGRDRVSKKYLDQALEILEENEVFVVSELGVIDRSVVAPLPVEEKLEAVNVEILQSMITRFFPSYDLRDSSLHTYQVHHNDLSVAVENCVFPTTADTLKQEKFDTMQPVLTTPMPKMRPTTLRESKLSAAKRNFSVPNQSGTVDEWSIAREMMTKFLLFFDPVKLGNVLKERVRVSADDMQDWLDGQDPCVAEMILGDHPLFDTACNKYSFGIKRCPKCTLTDPAHLEYVALQTIVFHEKYINSIFCVVMREIKKRVIYALDPRFMLYTDITPQDFAANLKKIFPPAVAALFEKMELDISKYDKSQAYLTLCFEVLLLTLFGVREDLIHIWVNAHMYTKVSDKFNGFSFRVPFQRKSGDASTFIFNTLFLMGVVAYMWCPSTLACGLFSGDDSLLFGKNLKENRETSKIALLFNLETKFFDYHYSYFCSKFLIPVNDDWSFTADPLKLLVKLGRSDLRNEHHVEEYRVSFNDHSIHLAEYEVRRQLSFALAERYNVAFDTTEFLYQLYLAGKPENFKKLFYAEPGANLLYDRSYAKFD